MGVRFDYSTFFSSTASVILVTTRCWEHEDACQPADSPQCYIDATNRRLVHQIHVHKFSKTTYLVSGRHATLQLLTCSTFPIAPVVM